MKDLKPGGSFVAVTDFFSETGAPLVLNTAPDYAVRDENQNLIVAGIGEQTTRAERWRATISLPDTLTEGNYFVIWKGVSGKTTQVNREQFSVVDATPNYYELDLLVPERSSIVDVLKAESGENITDITVEVITTEGTPLYRSQGLTDISSGVQGNQQIFKLKTPRLATLDAGPSAFAVYLINWSFLVDGEPETEHHFVYVVNPNVLAYVNELKRMIDKAGIQHPNVNLRYNNVDMVAYLNNGLQWLNAQPPQQTGYTLGTIPNSLYSYVLYAAAIHALESRYMAEAEAAFNFSGQPIELQVDRTGFIESAIGRYQDKLSNVNDVKKGIAMSGGSGVSSGSLYANSQGSLTLSEGPLTYLSLMPQYNSRVAGYNLIMSSLGYIV